MHMILSLMKLKKSLTKTFPLRKSQTKIERTNKKAMD